MAAPTPEEQKRIREREMRDAGLDPATGKPLQPGAQQAPPPPPPAARPAQAVSQVKSQPKRVAPIDAFRSDLLKMKEQFAMALPPHVPVDRLIRVIVTAVQDKPDLLNLDKSSLIGACMKAAQDGLLPDGREGALVPYKGIVKWMPMIGGILKKVRNSGELSSITVQLVREGELFKYWVDELGEHIRHEPKLTGDTGDAVLGYAFARTKDGGLYMEAMSREEIEKVRAVSKAKDDGPWITWWDEMAKKTILRRLSKRLPMSTDLEDLVTRVDEDYDFRKEDGPKTSSGQPRRILDIVAHSSPASVEPAQEEAPKA